MSTTTNKAENQNGQAPTVQPEKNISDMVMAKIKVFEETGSLNIPKNYSPANALRIAWLILQDTKNMDKRPVLEVCTRESVANALLRMIILGLNPVKRQCSFIAYGNQLTCQREYQGTIAIAKRHGVKKVTGCAVFKDDVFEYVILEDGTHKVSKHVQTIESIDTGIVKAAYATKEYEDGHKETRVMSMSQIKKAWEQGQTKGQSPAHKNFPDEMAIKTVINRILKTDVNSSDDADLFVDGDEEDNSNGKDQVSANVESRIEEKANRIDAGFEEREVDPATETSKEQQEETAPY